MYFVRGFPQIIKGWKEKSSLFKMWDGLDENICVMKFPEIEKEFIEKYQMGDIYAKSLKEGWAAYHVKPTFGLVKPEWLNLYDYQQEAIKIGRQMTIAEFSTWQQEQVKL